MDFHTLIAARDGIARLLSPKNSSGCPVSLVRNSLRMPSSGSIIQDQVIAATTPEIRNGQSSVPVTGGPLRNFVELPVSWELDDAPYFLFSFFPYMSGLSTPAQVLEIWKSEFDGSYGAGGCFLLVVHPFCIGRHPRIAMLDELIEYIKEWFAEQSHQEA